MPVFARKVEMAGESVRICERAFEPTLLGPDRILLLLGTASAFVGTATVVLSNASKFISVYTVKGISVNIESCYTDHTN